MPQQLADGVFVGGHVGGAGQRQHLVRAAGREQRADIRSVCAATTLSSAIPWISSSGRVRLAASVMVEQRLVSFRVLLRQAEEPLPPVRVVQPLIVRGGPGDGGVEHVGPADHGDGRERPAVGPAADPDPPRSRSGNCAEIASSAST